MTDEAVPVASTTDRIEIRGLRAVGIVGALPEEQVRAQPIEVDLDVVVDLAASGRSDELADTLDYSVLVTAVEGVISGERFRLLERLAARLTEVVLEDSRVRELTVAVRKLRPPVPQQLDTIGVRITRRR